MCFSAEISFGAAALLGVTGVVALKKVTQPRQFLFAAMPVLFAIQQACEGILWLSLSHSALVAWQKPMTYAFLFFAQMLWTTWLPLSFLLLEANERRRKFLWISLIAGICCSLLLGYRLFTHHVKAEIDCLHIYYDIVSPQWMISVSSILYVIAIIFPPFTSELKQARLLGVLLAGSLLFTKLAYENYLISVWCFFAALLSVMILYMMRQFQQAPLPIAEIRHQH